MFATVRVGGKQYTVKNNDLLTTEKIDAKKGAVIHLEEVLALDAGTDVTLGNPTISGATVSVEVVEHTRSAKVLVFKKKRRQNYRRKNGHRQHLTTLRVIDITGKNTAIEPRITKAKKVAAQEDTTDQEQLPEGGRIAPTAGQQSASAKVKKPVQKSDKKENNIKE